MKPRADRKIGPRQRPLKIVVLDDQEMMVEAVSLTLESLFDSATILKFTDSLQALRQLNLMDPDLLTLDWDMPKLTGDQVLDFLSQKGVRYPIVLITGQAEEPTVKEQVAKYKARGLNLSLVGKPFTRDHLGSEMAAQFDDHTRSLAA